MTRLVAALLALNLYAEIDLAGCWVKLQGAQCAVYVVAAAWGNGDVTWCEGGQTRVVVWGHARSIPNVAHVMGLWCMLKGCAVKRYLAYYLVLRRLLDIIAHLLR